MTSHNFNEPTSTPFNQSENSDLTASARQQDETIIFSQSRSQDFVGRQQEILNVTASLDASLKGNGRVVMIAGEPGIGKTRIAQELASMASLQGAMVWWGWCYEGHGSPPYWPWLRSLRQYIQQANPDRLAIEMSLGAPDISEIIPEVVEKLPELSNLELTDQVSPESARFRLFDAVTLFLKNVAKTQPLLIVLDDLQWADASSLRLLEFVAREINTSPVMVVGTYRDIEVTIGDPLSQALGDLIRDQSFHKIELSGLSQPEVGELVQKMSGVSPSDAVVEAVHSRTEGNPLFLGEIMSQMSPEDIATGAAIIRPIPEGVRDVIGRRLSPLSDTCRRTLSVASVIGRDFSLDLLDQLIDDVSIDKLLGVLEEAQEARLIEEFPGQRPRFVFTHPLIQEALLNAVPSARSIRLHMRIAQTLEKLGETEPETYAAEIAHHCAEAEPVMGVEKLVHYSLLAGNHAMRSYAFEDAERYFKRALQSKLHMPMDEETAELLSGLGRAQALLLERHEISDAIGNLSRAFDYFAEIGDTHRAVNAVQLPISPLPGLSTGAADLISSAMNLEDLNSNDLGKLWNVFGRVIGVEEGDYDRSIEALSQALTIAEENQDELLKRQALASTAYVNYLHSRWQESLDSSLEAIGIATRASDPYAEVTARYVAPLNLITMGSLDDAKYHASSLLASAQRARDSFSLTSAYWVNEIVARLTGDSEASRQFIRMGLNIAPKDPRLLFSGGVLEFQTGNYQVGNAYLNVLIELMNVAPPGPTTACSNPITVAAMASYTTGKEYSGLSAIEASAERVLSSPNAVGTVAQIARIGLAILSIMRDDSNAARNHYLAFKPYEGTFMAYCLSTDRMLGLLANTMGLRDEATGHFQAALEFCQRSGYLPECGWISFEYALCLRGRNHADDREKAMSLFEDAEKIADEFGLLPLSERLLSIIGDDAESLSDRPVEYPDRLTEREVEVLNLLARGRTNKEIAESLFISQHTAVRHVSNILSKTGSANRAEAAMYAAKNNLTS